MNSALCLLGLLLSQTAFAQEEPAADSLTLVSETPTPPRAAATKKDGLVGPEHGPEQGLALSGREHAHAQVGGPQWHRHRRE